jgi:cytochrome b561
MPFRNTSDRFGSVAKAFHWLTLLLLVGSFTLALSMVASSSFTRGTNGAG